MEERDIIITVRASCKGDPRNFKHRIVAQLEALSNPDRGDEGLTLVGTVAIREERRIGVPQWDKGQRFFHRDTGLEFQVIDVSILRPEGNIGYRLKPLKDCGLHELRRLESELERDFIPGEPT